MQYDYDLIVVGCGFCGSVIARLAADEGKKVLILERRKHIAGNMYDEYDENGILIQKYGPHVFHTDEDKVYEFVTRFGEWEPYKVFYDVVIDGKNIPMPFGFRAIDILYAEEDAADLKRRLLSYYPGCKSVSILELLKSSDTKICAFANMLYQKNYRPYAAKQWSLEPDQMNPSVVGRMPVILSDRRNSLDSKYELLPKGGFTGFFQKLLDHANIEIRLNTNALDVLSVDTSRGTCTLDGREVTVPIIYTGALEELFSDQTHPLPYRSLYFDFKTIESGSYQPVFIMAHPQEHSYLRTTEFTKCMTNPPKDKTVVAFEYPVPYDKHAEKGNEPYYPILTEENVAQNDQYIHALSKIKNLIPCGRLADYKYYNMDQVIVRAFDVFNQVNDSFWKGGSSVG